MTPIAHASLIAAALLVSVANAQTDSHDHDHDHSHDHDHAPLHAPDGADAHEGHAHPGVGLAHPIVTESPLPETKLRLNYHFADGDEGIEHEVEVEAEYAFTQNFSVEAIVPYVFVNPDEGDAENGLGDSILSLKLASYEWVDHQVLPAIGLEIILPTGDEEKGIGSDHVIELEPFVRVGYWNGPFEFIATAGVGIPFNQTDEEDAEEDFGVVYNLSTLYHVGPNLQALIELHGETVFGEEDVSAFYISPGITFQPLDDKSINFGLGLTLPLTDDRDFDYAVNMMTIIHF